MKLATICDISHVISYTRPSSPLFFFWGHREEGLGTRLMQTHTLGLLVDKLMPTKGSIKGMHTINYHPLEEKLNSCYSSYSKILHISFKSIRCNFLCTLLYLSFSRTGAGKYTGNFALYCISQFSIRKFGFLLVTFLTFLVCVTTTPRVGSSEASRRTLKRQSDELGKIRTRGHHWNRYRMR